MKPKTYKAALFRSKGSVDVADLPYPECGDDDVIVKNLLAGCCGTDISAYANGGDSYMIWKDHEFGHEMISEVVEVGKNVKDVKVGDHLFPNMGQALRDRNRMATVGAFSEYIRIVQYEPNYSAIPIDKDIPLKRAVLFEPFVIGTRAALSLQPGPGKTAIVFGAGIIGISAAIMLKYYGCDKVMVIAHSEFRLKNAGEFGLLTCSLHDDWKAKVIAEFGSTQCFGGEACGANLFVDAVGAQAAIDQFQEVAGRNAVLGVVGIHHEPATVDMMRVTYNNWKISGSGGVSIFDAAKDILSVMKSGTYNLEALVTHEYPLEKIGEALVMGKNSKEAQKVIISYV
jgi:threonine dehydrogenase-like Zn-dependent dehydrogenase